MDSRPKSIYKSYIFFLSLLGFIFLSVFSYLNYKKGNINLSITELILSISSLFALVHMSITKKEIVGRYVALTIMIVISIANLLSGGYQNTGIYWLFILPALTYFVGGLKLGSIISFSLILVLYILGHFENIGIITLPFESTDLIFAATALIFNTLMVLIYQRIADQSYSNIEKLLVEQEAFNKLLILSNQSITPKEFATEAAKIVGESLSYDAVSIYTLELGEKELKLLGGYKLLPKVMKQIRTISIDNPAYAKVLQEKKPQYIDNFSNVDPVLSRSSTRKSVAILPLMDEEVLIGTFSVSSNKQIKFTPDLKDILERMAREISITFSKVRSDGVEIEELA